MVGIIAAMDIEMQALLDKMKGPVKYVYAGMDYYKGKLEGVDTVICKCGVGKTNAAMHTQILIDKFSPKAIIQNGLAGSLQKNVEQLELVIGSELVYHDMQDFVIENFEPLQAVYKSDATLLEYAKEAAGEEGVHVGRIATGDWFVSSQNEKEEILKKTGALCCEMEGCAVAQTAFLNQVPFVVLRSISDTADENAEMDFEKIQGIAAECLVDIILHVIKKI